MANIYDVPGIEGLIRSADTTMANLSKVASGSGLHEQAMRDYLDPFTRNRNVQVGKGAVGDYMSNYLENYIDPNNQAGGKFGEGRRPNEMKVVGLGESPNPFTKSGIARAAEMAKDPSFQAENLFGEGTLTKVPGGYDYTGGKFDFNFAGPLEEMIFAPSTYGMKFDKDMNVLDKFDRDFRSFDQAKMGGTRQPSSFRSMNNPEVYGELNNKGMMDRLKGGLGSIRDTVTDKLGSVGDFITGGGILGSIIDTFGSRGDLSTRGIAGLNANDVFNVDMFGTEEDPTKDRYGYNIVSGFGNYDKFVKDKARELAKMQFKTKSGKERQRFFQESADAIREKERQRDLEEKRRLNARLSTVGGGFDQDSYDAGKASAAAQEQSNRDAARGR